MAINPNSNVLDKFELHCWIIDVNATNIQNLHLLLFVLFVYSRQERRASPPTYSGPPTMEACPHMAAVKPGPLSTK